VYLYITFFYELFLMLLFHLIGIFFLLDTFILKGINKLFFDFFLPFRLLVRGAKKKPLIVYLKCWFTQSHGNVHQMWNFLFLKYQPLLVLTFNNWTISLGLFLTNLAKFHVGWCPRSVALRSIMTYEFFLFRGKKRKEKMPCV